MCLTSDKRQKLDKEISYRREVLKPPTNKTSSQSYKDEDNDIILLICWLVEDKKDRLRSVYPYPYYKYDTIKDGNQKVIYTQLVRPGSLYLPLYAVHDVDTKPDYEFEGSSMAAMMIDRFWGFPFELFRKLRRQYFGCFDFEFLFSSFADGNSGVLVDKAPDDEDALAESDEDNMIEEVDVREESESLQKKTTKKKYKPVQSQTSKSSNKLVSVHEEEDDDSDDNSSVGLGNFSDEEDDENFSDDNEGDRDADDT
jgi:hypothetical protein